jgi:hypothetical protein
LRTFVEHDRLLGKRWRIDRFDRRLVADAVTALSDGASTSLTALEGGAPEPCPPDVAMLGNEARAGSPSDGFGGHHRSVPPFMFHS